MKGFSLVTEHRHYNARPTYASCYYVARVVFFIAECGITRFLYHVHYVRVMRVFDVLASP